MKTGIIVAMEKELALLLPHIENLSKTTVNGFTFHCGRMGGRDIVVSQCGIGKVNAAVGALTLIDSFHPAIVINTGVAGGTGSSADAPTLLDVVLADAVAYHDVWCGFDSTHGQAAGCPAVFTSPLPPQIREQLGVKGGLVASGDIFISEPDDLARVLKIHPDAVAVDMESAAIAHVCHLKSVPFVCIRVISDTPSKADNSAQYRDFWAEAPQLATDTLSRLIALL